ncbi:MAG TPA: type II secretion system protein [Phycisphaerae bacterium]|nr:type II secretion system protein [Phycisphaerae bacterium]
MNHKLQAHFGGTRVNRFGFTIIELLVVMAVISLLTTILLPALSNARRSARRTECSAHLREIGLAASMYLQAEKTFPSLNNEPEDGHWQYNYVIWDGRDFDHNFGPMVQTNLFPDMQVPYCPTQESPYHRLNTFVNPWPVKQLLDTRAGYGRRPRVTGMDVTQMPVGWALYADLFHTPDYIASDHRSGINAAHVDGSVRFVSNFESLIDNDMTLPTSLIDNPTMMKIWTRLDSK